MLSAAKPSDGNSVEAQAPARNALDSPTAMEFCGSKDSQSLYYQITISQYLGNAIIACLVGATKLFYAEIIALDKCDPEGPLEVPTRSLDKYA